MICGTGTGDGILFLEILDGWGLQEGNNMDSIKHFFDVLDYVTLRASLYVLMVLGAWAVIRHHGKRA
jgi:hypothetical protein